MKKYLFGLSDKAIRILASTMLFASAFTFSLFSFKTVSVILYILSLVLAGTDVFLKAVKGIFRGDFLDENFLMAIASLGALILGEYSEACAVMIFYQAPYL